MEVLFFAVREGKLHPVKLKIGFGGRDSCWTFPSKTVNRTLGNRETMWEGKQTRESYPIKLKIDNGG
ncbi:hypothetical protein RKD52_002746 [Metabacillus sp. SLBN-84]